MKTLNRSTNYLNWFTCCTLPENTTCKTTGWHVEAGSRVRNAYVCITCSNNWLQCDQPILNHGTLRTLL